MGASLRDHRNASPPRDTRPAMSADVCAALATFAGETSRVLTACGYSRDTVEHALTVALHAVDTRALA